MTHAMKTLKSYCTNNPVLSVPSSKNHSDFHLACLEGSQEWYHQAELCSAANTYREGYVYASELQFFSQENAELTEMKDCYST